DRLARKMPLEVRLVDGDILHANDALQALHLEDGIHHQKGIAVRQNLLNFHDVQYHSRSPSRRAPHQQRLALPRQTCNYMRTPASGDTRSCSVTMIFTPRDFSSAAMDLLDCSHRGALI